MVYSEEQLAEVKKQIFEQTKHLSPDQRAQIEEQINQMSAEQLEEFVRQQMAPRGGGKEKGVFRMIVDGDVPSKKIDENKDAVAVVSIRPVSKGHVIIIPKNPARDAKEIPSSVIGLAKKIAKKMTLKLKASATEIQTSSAFGETIVNVIPVYDKRVNVNSPTYEASEDEILEVFNKLRVVKKPKREVIRRTKKAETTEILKLRRRIP